MKLKKITTLLLSLSVVTSTSLTGFSAMDLSNIYSDNVNTKNIVKVSSTSHSAISASNTTTEIQNVEFSDINYDSFGINCEPSPAVDYLDIYEKIKATENYEDFYWIEFPLVVGKDINKFNTDNALNYDIDYHLYSSNWHKFSIDNGEIFATYNKEYYNLDGGFTWKTL